MSKEKRTTTIDADLLEGIIKRLLQIEAWAAGLQEECYKIRMLIEKQEGVSTPPKGRQGLSDQELAAASVRFKKRFLKNPKGSK